MWPRRYLDTANAITLINVALGFWAVGMVLAGSYYHAAILIVVCGTVDHLDGYIARKLNPSSKEARAFGRILDMLADLIAFSIAPAHFLIALNDFSIPSMFVGTLFALFGAVRLVRYEIEPSDVLGLYKGLPTTYAAYLFCIAMIACLIIEANSMLLIMITLCLAVLQVSSLSVRKPPLWFTVFIMPVAGLSLIIWGGNSIG